MRWGILIIVLFVFLGCEVMDMLDFDSEIAKIVKDQNPNACADLKGESEKQTKSRQDKCYKEVAFAMKRSDLCKKVTDTKKKDDCYVDLAEDIGNLALCDEVENAKNQCMAKVAIAEQDDIICDSVEGQYKDYCYKEIGKLKLSVEICNRVEAHYERGRCISHIAAEKKDVSLCKEVPDRNSRDCYIGVALATGDPSVCEKIGAKDSCYGLLAINKNDAALCRKIIEESGWDSCYSSLARTNKDASLCTEMTDEEWKYECVEELAKENAEACEALHGDLKARCQAEYGYTV